MRSGTRFDSERRVLGVVTEEFGAYSNVFVQRQIDALCAWQAPFVACHVRSNPEVFDYEPVHLLRAETPSLALRARRLIERVLPRRLHRASSIEACVELRACIEHYRPEFLHIQFGWPAARLLPVLRETGVPFSIVLHGSDLNSACERPRSAYARQLVEAFELSRVCLFVSEDLRRKGLALGCPAEKARVHYLGVPLAAELAAPGEGEPLRLISVGRLIDCKGHAVLLRAFAQLVGRGIRAELCIIGEGPLRAELEGLARELGIADRLELLERLPNAEVYAKLRRSHVYAHPSLRLPGGDEGLGLAVQEAMAVGLPVVASATGGIPESVLPDKTGILVPPADAEKLCEALAQLAGDPELRVRMGRAGRERIETSFDMAHQNVELLKLIQGFCSASGEPV